MSESFRQLLDNSVRKVFTAMLDPEKDVYVIMLDCGHSFMCSSNYLNSKMLCRQCFEIKIMENENAQHTTQSTQI